MNPATKKRLVLASLCTALLHPGARAGEEARFDTAFLSDKPEVATYRTKDDRGSGLYQVSLSKSEREVEVVVNMITDGFTKTVWGAMGHDLRPLRSQATIVVAGQVRLDSRTTYEAGKLHVATLVKPFGRTLERTLPAAGLVVDPMQHPLLPRVLPLRAGAVFTFESLDPQKNELVPLKLEVLGEEPLGAIPCFKVQADGWEGRALYWVEKGPRRRVLRVEQPASHRVSELLSPAGQGTAQGPGTPGGGKEAAAASALLR